VRDSLDSALIKCDVRLIPFSSVCKSRSALFRKDAAVVVATSVASLANIGARRLGVGCVHVLVRERVLRVGVSAPTDSK
jgi:hypothetical protein